MSKRPITKITQDAVNENCLTKDYGNACACMCMRGQGRNTEGGRGTVWGPHTCFSASEAKVEVVTIERPECHVGDRVLVLRLGVRPEHLKWESRVQDTGPSETTGPHVISISENYPRDLCLNAKTQLHSMTSNSSAGHHMPDN